MASSRMKWRTAHVPTTGIVSTRVVGAVTRQALEIMIREAVALADTYRASAFLLDLRQAVCDVSTVGIYELPVSAASLGLPRASRVAIVSPRSSVHARDSEFYETRAMNSGFQHRVFAEPQTAIAWLCEAIPAFDALRKVEVDPQWVDSDRMPRMVTSS